MRPRRPRAKRIPPPKSDWSPRPIPQAADALHTADSVTPPLRELAQRARHADLAAAAGPATAEVTPAARSPEPARPDPLLNNTTSSRICGPVGLGDGAAMRSYVQKMRAVQRDWPSLSEDARLARVQAVTNATLQQDGVPTFPIDTRALGTGRGGQFDPQRWAMTMNEGLFGGKSLPDDQARELAATVLHESRHAEQFFLVARRRAAEGADASAINRAVGIPGRIASAARARPLPPPGPPGTPEHVLNECARVLDVTLTGAGRDELARVYGQQDQRLAAASRLDDEFDAVAGKVGKGKASLGDLDRVYNSSNAADDAAKRTHDLYEHLPNEADSFSIGARVRKLWR